VREIDVLPTIARVAHVRPDWKVEGVPLIGPHRRRPPASTLLFERDGRRIVLSGRDLHRRAAAALRLKLQLFGAADSGPGLYGIGPFSSMHGTPVNRWPALPRSGTRAVLDGPDRYRNVRLDAGSLPVKVSGRLTGTNSGDPTNVAVAIDGTIAATAPTVSPRRHARQVVSLLIPESALHEGNNRLEIFAIERRQGTLALRPL
jgi:hypothetical protein